MKISIKIIAVLSLLILFANSPQNRVSAQSDEKNVPVANGVWQTVVTPRICATGAPIGVTFPGILLFSQDGTITGTSTAVTSTYGVWRREPGRGEYSFTTLSLKYDAAGMMIGSRRISQSVTLDETGDSFVSAGTFQDYDPVGNPTISGCSTSTGTRFQ